MVYHTIKTGFNRIIRTNGLIEPNGSTHQKNDPRSSLNISAFNLSWSAWLFLEQSGMLSLILSIPKREIMTRLINKIDKVNRFNSLFKLF